jgi:hypothetical protein
VVFRGVRALEHPALWFLVLALTGFVLNPKRRETNTCIAGILCVVGLIPFIVQLVSSGVWSAPQYSPTQHTLVARNLAEFGVYGWNAHDVVQYGLPPDLAASWQLGDTPSVSAWTYPGYTVILAAILFIASQVYGVVDRPEQLLICLMVNAATVISGLMVLFFAIRRVMGNALIAALSIAAFEIAGWPMLLTFDITSEPLQFFINCYALFVSAKAMRDPDSICWRDTALLAFAAGYGQVTKPIVGALLPAAVLLVLLFQIPREGEVPRWRSAVKSISHRQRFLLVLLLITPTAVWLVRNIVSLGMPIFTSSAGPFFLAQGLTLQFVLPSPYGANELEYRAIAASMVPGILDRVVTDRDFLFELLRWKWRLLIESFTSATPGLMSAASSGFGGGAVSLLLSCSFVAFLAASLCLPAGRRSVAWALQLSFFIFIAAIFLSQPLPKYFQPFLPLYVFFPLLVCGALSNTSSRRLGAALLTSAVAFTVFYSFLYVPRLGGPF